MMVAKKGFSMARLKYLLLGTCMLPVMAMTTAFAQDEGNAKAPFKPKACSEHVTPATSDIADDLELEPAVRKFLVKLNKNSSPFWELPQPKPQDILTALQNETKVDMSGVNTTEQLLTVDGRDVKLFLMKPDHLEGHPGVILFLHGGVWIVGDFENHKRLLRDIVVEVRTAGSFPAIYHPAGGQVTPFK